MMLDHVPALVMGYTIGSIPFGLLLARVAGKGDIRKIGSGNIGATNVLRTGSKGLAAATLLLDLAKGFLAVALARELFGGGGSFPQAIWAPVPLAALGAVVGHCLPVWLGFRGGKGVATHAGVCLGLGWGIGLAYALVWLGMLAAMRISSLAGISAVCAAPVTAALLGYTHLVPVLALLAAFVVFLHRANIARLIAGTEPVVGTRR